MPAVSADQTVERPNPQGPKRNPGVLEEFAQNMSESIIQSSQSQMSRLNQNRGMLAEEFASTIIEVALGELFGGPYSAGHHLEGSAVVEMDGMDGERSTETDPGKGTRTSKDTWRRHPSLSQPGLTGGGSLDYPDAPPTTPLLPELERSRHGFSRMLKGGLAEVYPPSTPPPTPNDGKGHGAASDPQVELMEHLMHSLFTDGFEEGARRRAKMAAFAEALSRNIVDSALGDKNGRDLHLLAHQMAGAIITSSLDEAKTLV